MIRSFYRDRIKMYDTEPESCDPGRLRHPRPEPFACLDCGWRAKGYIARSQHWYATKHQIVSASDPRVVRDARDERRHG